VRLALAAAPRPEAAPARVRVMVCDDSLTVRAAMCRILASDPCVEVVGRAGNGAEAVRQIAAIRPEVLVLDVEMPVLDGLAALPLLLGADPDLKVLMSSSLTTRGAEVALRALRAGAADYVPKPASAAEIGGAGGFAAELLAKVKGLAALRPTHAQARVPRTDARPMPQHDSAAALRVAHSRYLSRLGKRRLLLPPATTS